MSRLRNLFIIACMISLGTAFAIGLCSLSNDLSTAKNFNVDSQDGLWTVKFIYHGELNEWDGILFYQGNGTGNVGDIYVTTDEFEEYDVVNPFLCFESVSPDDFRMLEIDETQYGYDSYIMGEKLIEELIVKWMENGEQKTSIIRVADYVESNPRLAFFLNF